MHNITQDTELYMHASPKYRTDANNKTGILLDESNM